MSGNFSFKIQHKPYKCTCLQNLVVTGLVEMEILILTSILTWIPLKNHIERFSKLGRPIYNYEVPDMACRKTRRRRLRRRILTITKRFALHINATNPFAVIMCQVNIKSDIC